MSYYVLLCLIISFYYNKTYYRIKVLTYYCNIVLRYYFNDYSLDELSLVLYKVEFARLELRLRSPALVSLRFGFEVLDRLISFKIKSDRKGLKELLAGEIYL